MAIFNLRPGLPAESQVREFLDQGADTCDEVAATGVVDFHSVLADADEDFDLTVEDVLHQKLIGFGVPSAPMFSYKRVVSDTELEIEYTTGIEGLVDALEGA